MSMGQSSMTPADVAAVVDNNRGGFSFGYPVMPYPIMGGFGGGFGGGYGFGGDFLAILLLFALFGGGWGGGFGGFGGFGGAGLGLTDGGLLGYAIGNNATKGDLTGVQTASKLDSIATQIGAGFANNSTQLCNGFSDVQAAIANGAYNINTGLLTGFANTNLNACQNTNSVVSALKDCCCENRQGIADLKYTVATENCADRAALESGVRDIITAQTANTQKLLDKLCDQELQAERRENQNLRSELMYARGQASQAAQTAAIQAGQVAEVDALYNRLVQCPVPSMPVYGMTPIFTCNRNSSCGCNNGSQYVLQ